MGSYKFNKKIKPTYNRRSRGQRLRRLREKRQKELSQGGPTTSAPPTANQPKRRKPNDVVFELQTFSEIIIHDTSEANGSASQDVACRPTPLSTPLLDSKISSYINFLSRIQTDAGNPLSGLQPARSSDIYGNPLPPGRAAFDSGYVTEEDRVIEAHNHACSYGGKLVFDRMIDGGYRYVCSKKTCREMRILKIDREKEYV